MAVANLCNIKTNNMKNLKERLSGLTPANIREESTVMSYPYLNEFLALLDRDFPEIRLAVGEEALNAMVVSRYVETYQRYITDSSVGGMDGPALDERFKKSLTEELTVGYFSEVRDIMEEDFPELFEEIEKDPSNAQKAVYASLASEVYKRINGKDVHRHLYIPPYRDGYSDGERTRIREALSMAINGMLSEG